MHLILVDPIDHVVGVEEADIREVSRVRLESVISGLDSWECQRLS